MRIKLIAFLVFLACSVQAQLNIGRQLYIGQQLPPKAADGSDLKHSLECAFLTIAVPHGFDTVLGTPWKDYHPLPEDHYVLQTYRNFLEQKGSNALRAVRKFYKA